MNRQERIDSIRRHLLNCKIKVGLNEDLPVRTFDQIISEFDNFIAFEDEARKDILKQLDDILSKVSSIIESILTTESNKHDNRNTATSKET